MNIIYFDKINSTNAYAKCNIKKLDDKDVISADFQSNGRGRFTRSWLDIGEGNIYMTIILKPSDEIKSIYANLTQYLSVCLCKELELLGLSPRIKWPNDVLVNGRKICGILAESVIKSGKLKGIALGIGINLNANSFTLEKIDKPATALNIELGESISKEEFMQKLLDRFFKDYDAFLNEGFILIKENYEKRSIFLNKEVNIAIFDKVEEGFVIGFSDDGELLLETAEGVVNINMGEII